MPLFTPTIKPSVLPMRVAASSQSWAVPASATEFLASLSARGLFDLTKFTEVRLCLRMNSAAPASAVLYIEYSTDNTTFAAIDGGTGTQVNLGSIGNRASNWVTIVSAARIASCYLRLVGSGGDGATSANFANLHIEVR